MAIAIRFTIAFLVLGVPMLAQNFQPSGKVILTLFGDYFYKAAGEAHHSAAAFADEPRDFQAFLIRRVYLGYQYQFTPAVLGKIVLEGNDGILNSKGSRSVFVKYAYVDLRDFLPLPFSLGMQLGAVPTPTWAFSEKFYGYRFLEKTPVDMRKFGSSNDAGLKFYGTFGKEGAIGYEIMVGNGRNGKPENDKYKKFYGSLQGKVFQQRLWFQLYGDYQDVVVESDGRNEVGSLIHWKGFLGLALDGVKIGIEGAYQSLQSDRRSSAGWILSTFVRLPVQPKLEGFLRVDYYDPDRDAADRYTELFVLTGLRWQLARKVVLMPNLWINAYVPQGNVPATAADVVLRLTFFWKY